MKQRGTCNHSSRFIIERDRSLIKPKICVCICSVTCCACYRESPGSFIQYLARAQPCKSLSKKGYITMQHYIVQTFSLKGIETKLAFIDLVSAVKGP
ncbi:hypothetical protein HUJ04_012530 [Dendroctonus ponderosae]|nr:hypothetical protein HUJ04_012530 [Dendroctonus ponderosae]